MEKYYEFINQCREKIYEGGTHKHHILPEFMGGTDDPNNLIKLSYEDHLQAHLILAECFPNGSFEWKGNMVSAHTILNCYLKGVYYTDKSYLTGIKKPEHANLMRERVLSGIHNLTFKGLTHSKETKIKMGESAIASWTDDRKKQYKEKWSGKNSPFSKLYSGAGNPNSKKVLDNSTGIIYSTVSELRSSLGISQHMWNKIKSTGRFDLNIKEMI